MYSRPVFKAKLLIICQVCFIVISQGIHSHTIEKQRMEEYFRRDHTWPPRVEDYKPNTAGWKMLNAGIFEQMKYMNVETSKRYVTYMSTINSALISQNFTEYGWGITTAPKPIVDKLKERLHQGLRSENKGHESDDECLETKSPPYFLGDDEMNKEILEALLPLHEAWIGGVELVPHMAYGLRVYRNDSNLLMHFDQQDTHVISSILHVDHGKDDEPWPIVIEDFHGNTNEIFLESGDLLFYESSKCRHGRPKKFRGEFYSSLFLHYHPKEWDNDERLLNVHFRIPSSNVWAEAAALNENNQINEMSLVSLCMKEAGCEHEWCRLNDTLKWHGPSPNYGQVFNGNGNLLDLTNIPTEESFSNLESVNTISKNISEISVPHFALDDRKTTPQGQIRI
jgi:hypothetical protein